MANVVRSPQFILVSSREARALGYCERVVELRNVLAASDVDARGFKAAIGGYFGGWNGDRRARLQIARAARNVRHDVGIRTDDDLLRAAFVFQRQDLTFYACHCVVIG